MIPKPTANPKADKKKLHLLSHSSLSSVSLPVVGSSLIVTCLSKLFLTSSFCLGSSSNSETFLGSAKNKKNEVMFQQSGAKKFTQFRIIEYSLASQGSNELEEITIAFF